MFRIGIIELGITCGLVALAIIIPLIVTRGYAALNKRLNKIENKMNKKD
ncbi:MAG: hypothetical protein Q8L87_11125 [Anaerolineales bacterium]|jgi:hypothetical protein|nr:hypothetical protein [Anaerolineales bacterium]